ncbi:MAG: 2-isopropylmalate synthase [Rubripirellula sp.]|nr:2-isopropylmalate synthase [Rubripirellula sp.]
MSQPKTVNDASTETSGSGAARTIKIFDTTLRDGEQSPGASMNLTEKLEVAQLLAEMGVDVIEAGFPIASPGDFEAVKLIAQTVRGSTICGLARCSDQDIDRAWEAIKHAPSSRIHVFLATSAIHREFKLRMSPDEIVERAVAGVRRAVGYCDDVEFSPEDACRTEHDFLCQVVEAAIDAGATTINIPDTVGYATPREIYDRFSMLRERVPNIDKAVISTHCHDDLGMAVANSLAAVQAGAGQIECTINGIGERAGNAALEEVVMALKTRSDYYDCKTNIDTKRLVPASRLVSKTTGIQVQRNKAIVGRNAFAHESGIHQDGMLKERSTYEIMSPEDVGFSKTDLVLGKHSGRAALADRAKTLGLTLTGEQLQEVFEQFKALADKKKEIYDGDIIALVQQQISGIADEQWSLVDYVVTSGHRRSPQVELTLRHGEKEQTERVEQGDGPIDAAFWAVEKITGIELVCKDFRVRSATLGRDAIGEVNLEVEHKGRSYRGVGVSTDSVESTILAMLNAINRIESERES